MGHGRPDSTKGVHLGIDGFEDAIEVGRGGFSVVYRAWQPAFRRTVAVKVLIADGFDEDTRIRFGREISAMGQLSDHPNIVTVHHAGTTAFGNPYIVMAYEAGGTLADQLARGEAGAWPDALAGGIAIAGALEAAHRAGVLHRDVKPENVLVSGYDVLKLADFGLAQSHRQPGARGGHTAAASVLHAAPEILAGGPASVAADVYSLGSTVFAWLSGAPAFVPVNGEPIEAVLRRIAAGAIPDLRPHGVPNDVCAAVECAMAADPGRRHQSVAEFAAALQRAQSAHGLPVTELVLGPGGPRVDFAVEEPAGIASAGARRSVLSLSARLRAAEELSATTHRVPARIRRPSRLARTARISVCMAAVLAVPSGTAAAHPLAAGSDGVEVPSAIDFGDAKFALKPHERVFTLRNPSARAVRVLRLEFQGPDQHDFGFGNDACSGTTVPAGGTCVITGTFNPENPGPRRGALVVVLRAGEPRTIALRGTGLRRYAVEDDAPKGSPCYADAYQVGPSAYGYRAGMIAMSVKQYWSPSCRVALAYVFVWLQYRKHLGADVPWRADVTLTRARVPGMKNAGPSVNGNVRSTDPTQGAWTRPEPMASGCTTVTGTLADDESPIPTTVTTAVHCA